MQMRVNRRQATATILGSAALLVASRGSAFWAADNPFTLGVASGEPAPDGVVLWTRLAPRAARSRWRHAAKPSTRPLGDQRR